MPTSWPRPRWPRTGRHAAAGCSTATVSTGALVLTSCRWVHTIGMRFPLDVAYVDDEGTVVKTARMARHRVGWPVSNASWVIEAEAGAFERWGLQPGDVVELRDGRRRRPPTAP